MEAVLDVGRESITGHKKTFGVMGMSCILITVTVSRVYMYVKIYPTTYFKKRAVYYVISTSIQLEKTIKT